MLFLRRRLFLHPLKEKLCKASVHIRFNIRNTVYFGYGIFSIECYVHISNLLLNIVCRGINLALNILRLRPDFADSHIIIQIQQRQQNKASVVMDNNVRYFLRIERARLRARRCATPVFIPICPFTQLLRNNRMDYGRNYNHSILQRKKVRKK